MKNDYLSASLKDYFKNDLDSFYSTNESEKGFWKQGSYFKCWTKGLDLKSLLGFPSPEGMGCFTLATPGTVSISDTRKANVFIMTRESHIFMNNLTQLDCKEELKVKAEASLVAWHVFWIQLYSHLKDTWYLCWGKLWSYTLFIIHVWHQEIQIRKRSTETLLSGC